MTAAPRQHKSAAKGDSSFKNSDAFSLETKNKGKTNLPCFLGIAIKRPLRRKYPILKQEIMTTFSSRARRRGKMGAYGRGKPTLCCLYKDAAAVRCKYASPPKKIPLEAPKKKFCFLSLVPKSSSTAIVRGKRHQGTSTIK